MSQMKTEDGEEKRYERKIKTPEQALSSLMRLCARSEKSSGDALRLMRRWGVDSSAMAGVLKKLTDTQFIDDHRYADAYVREKTRLAGWGAYKIRRMLTSKGIERDIIDQALGQVDRDMSEKRLSQMLEKKKRNTKSANSYEMKGKLMRYGMGLGYDYEQVISAVERVVKDED